MLEDEAQVDGEHQVSHLVAPCFDTRAAQASAGLNPVHHELPSKKYPSVPKDDPAP
jgi:hypothetical protein